jgi:hypothetical protein
LTRTRRRSARGWVIALLVGAVVVVTAGAAGADTESRRGHDRALAAEVCEPMVRESVVAAAQRSLAGRQRGIWQGSRYTCRYDFGGAGALLTRVRVYGSDDAATSAFEARRSAARKPSTLYGIGQDAFQVGTTLLVARKDNFVLTVDGRSLASTLHPDGVVFSATRAVFDCW